MESGILGCRDLQVLGHEHVLQVVGSRVHSRLGGRDEEVGELLVVLVDLDGTLGDGSTASSRDIGKPAELNNAVKVDRIEARFDDQGADEGEDLR